jgi:hemolysin activation/secretion protein
MYINAPFKLASLVSLLLLAESVWADILPGSAQPEQVSRALTESQPQPRQKLPPVITQPEEKAKSPLGPEAEKIKFQLNGIILEGNHIYSKQQLEPIYRDKLHKVITVAELFTIVQNITNYYRNNGYVISRAILPPQHVKGGVVRIQVIEGFIGNVDVTGHPYRAKCLVLDYGKQIAKCPPLQIKRMEHYMLLANEIPGVNVKAVLSPSKTQTGAADLTMVTDTRRVMGYLSYDNYGTRYIGPQQMTANLTLNSTLQAGDSIQATMTKTPKGEELTYNDLNYTMPVNAEGVRFQVGTTRARTHPLFVLEPVDIDGVNWNYYTMFQFPWIRDRTQTLTGRAGFNWLDTHVTTFNQELYTDHIRSLDFGGSYSFADRWYGSNLFSVDYRQGLPILGYTSDTDVLTAQTSRPGGHAFYTKFIGQASRLQAIKGPVSLYGLISGQTAFQPLLSSEQFTFGGSQLGRGYDVAELIGDRGLAGSLELRYDWFPNKFKIQTLEFYAFYDAGVIWNIEVNPTSPAKVSATSAGLGMRFYATKYISGNVMWAQPLTKQVAAEELIGDGWRPRVFFSIVAQLG